ncbi:MAG: hypothetical protein V3S55_10015 [Nitrospiraceae bacterium]
MFQKIIEDLRDRWADRHSRIKVAKIRRVFAREGGLIAGSFSSEDVRVCDHPGRCAMGALLVAAGVPERDVRMKGTNADQCRLIEKTYGLHEYEMGHIITANDSGTWRLIWGQCGIRTRPVEQVRVCVVNDRVRELASA